MNKYHLMLEKIITKGKEQANKKGNIKFLLNQKLELKGIDLLEIFEGHGIARKKLSAELELFQKGERLTESYRSAGITWWDYCGPILVNSYPSYFEQLPDLIKKINKERRTSKNYVLFLGRNDVESNQQPCLSLIQFQIDNDKLIVSAYQRSSDASLGLPADLYHLYLISRQINIQLKSITLFLGNVHIYENNIEGTKCLLNGEDVKFNLNVN
ncbi:thymidylate synthase [Sphingobacterium sp. ML3W]|nr:thymidylate synthase [Sphingobacterium sp. ML3W]